MAKRFDPKAKAKKQKIVAAVLGVILVGVMVYQAPTILGMFGGSSSEVATEPAPQPPAAPAAPAPGSPAPAAPAAPSAGGSASLVDSDQAPQPTQSQLVTFDRFESKDPFVPQAEEGPEGRSPAPAPDTGDEPTGLDIEEPEISPSEPAEPESVNTAKISVNGVSTVATVGGTFPEDDPIFELVSVTKTSAKVGIADGTYATGAPTITLKRGGKPVTLMNTADGTTYVLRLLSVG
jgi:hypothetical protein